MSPVDAGILIFDDAEELDFAGPWEVLGTWGARLRLLGESTRPVRCRKGLTVVPGALVLAAAGMLDGRRATTHWSAYDELRAAGTDIEVDEDARFVDEGDVITAAGVSAGIDMALHLVARLDSPDRAREVKREIQYEPEPPV